MSSVFHLDDRDEVALAAALQIALTMTDFVEKALADGRKEVVLRFDLNDHNPEARMENKRRLERMADTLGLPRG